MRPEHSEKILHCPECGNKHAAFGKFCTSCGAALVNDRRATSTERNAVHTERNDSRLRRLLANQDLRLALVTVIGTFIVGLLFAIFGIVLVYLGAAENLQIRFFGEISSTGPGIAAIFIGGVLVVLVGRGAFGWMRGR